jgi:hypothetical protein
VHRVVALHPSHVLVLLEHSLATSHGSVGLCRVCAVCVVCVSCACRVRVVP